MNIIVLNDLQFDAELCYLLTSNLELEGLPPVPRAVNLLTVGQGQYIVTGHCLTSPTREILYTWQSTKS